MDSDIEEELRELKEMIRQTPRKKVVDTIVELFFRDEKMPERTQELFWSWFFSQQDTELKEEAWKRCFEE